MLQSERSSEVSGRVERAEMKPGVSTVDPIFLLCARERSTIDRPTPRNKRGKGGSINSKRSVTIGRVQRHERGKFLSRE